MTASEKWIHVWEQERENYPVPLLHIKNIWRKKHYPVEMIDKISSMLLKQICRTKPKCNLVNPFFPGPRQFASFFNYELSLVHCDICLYSDWQLRFHWFWFYSTESNSLYHSFILFSGSLQSLFLGNKFTKGKPDKVRCSSNSNTFISVWLSHFQSFVLLLMTTKDCALWTLALLDSFYTQQPAVQIAQGIARFMPLRITFEWNNSPFSSR